MDRLFVKLSTVKTVPGKAGGVSTTAGAGAGVTTGVTTGAGAGTVTMTATEPTTVALAMPAAVTAWLLPVIRINPPIMNAQAIPG